MVIVSLKIIQQGNVVERDSERGWRSLRVAEEECFLEEVTSGLDLDNKVETVDWRLGEISFC